jgi:surface protein
MANNKHNQLKRQYSLDGGITWKDLSPMVYKVGNITETNSECTDKDGCRWRILPLTTDSECDSSYRLYQIEIEECLNDEGVYVPSGERRRYKLIEDYSISCGYSGPICTPTTRYEYSYDVIYNGGAVEYNQVATPVVYQITTTIETDKGCNEISYSTRKQIYDYGITYSPSGDNISEEDRTVTATVTYSGSTIGSFEYTQNGYIIEEAEPTLVGKMVFKCDTNNISAYYYYSCDGVRSLRNDFTVTDNGNGEYIYSSDVDFNDDGCDRINSLTISNIGDIAYEIVSFPDTSNVTSFYSLFYSFDNPKLKAMNLTTFNTSSLTNMSEMFKYCDNLETLNLSGWDVSNVTNMNEMFYYCRNLIYLNLSGWELSANITEYKGVFSGCTNLQKINMVGSSCESVNRVRALLYMSSEYGELLNQVTIITDAYCATNAECSDNSECGNLLSLTPCRPDFIPNSMILNNIKYDNVFPSINEIDVFNTVLSVDISTLSGALPLTSTTDFLISVTNTSDSVSSILCFPDVSNVTDMSRMFINNDASYLGELHTALKCINARGWNTSKVTNMNDMFWLQPYLTDIIGIEDWDTSNVTDMGGMFYGCRSLTTLDLSKWDMSNVIYQDSYGELSVLGDKGMFENCNSLVSLQLPKNINKLTRLTSMFSDCRSLTSLDVRNIDTSKVEYFYYMFAGCSSLTNIIGIENFVTSNAKGMGSMFASCRSLTTLDLSKWDVSNVITDIFWQNTQIHKGFNGMFRNCSNLTTLNLSGWDVSQNLGFNEMFDDCVNLTNIIGIEDWDVNGSVRMKNMFRNCSSLTSLDLSGWKVSTSNVDYMFYGCANLRTLNISGWNIVGSTYGGDAMFSNCNSLTTIYAYGCDSTTINILNSVKPTNCTLVY